MSSQVIFILFITQFISLQGASIYCNSAFECVNNSWVTSSTNEDIYGRGYQSLSGASTSVTNNFHGISNYVSCRGALACSEISFISSSDSVYCTGSHSCFNIHGSSSSINITANNDTTIAKVYCYGYNACTNTNIRATNMIEQTSISVWCHGDQSCNNANITSMENINAGGAYSLYGSIIDSNFIAPNTLTVKLFGYQSGFGGKIICRVGDTCKIYCYYNGCENLYLHCEDENNCNFNVITNSNDPNITIPPITNINDLDVNLYDLKYIVPENDQFCDTVFVYDNYWQQQSNINMNIENGGPVCCRGANSCKSAGTIEFTANMPDVLVCTGSRSCETRVISTDGNVFCEGEYSCKSAVVNGKSNVYCVGVWACDSITINKAKNVYCSSYYSCRHSEITTNGSNSNIYFLGYWAGDGVDIFCITGDQCNVICGAYDSCGTNTILHCNNNCFVYCNDDTGCPLGNYTKVLRTTTTTENPTKVPSAYPTDNPSISPSTFPSVLPAMIPTDSPAMPRSENPTKSPLVDGANIHMCRFVLMFHLGIIVAMLGM